MAGLVSVVIPTYNRAQLVVRAVESALRQPYRPLEVVVLDDGSTDGTREALAPYEGRIVYRFQPNGGFSSARSHGYQASRGDYVVFLDSDDELEPAAVEAGVRALKAHPECAAAYGRALDVNPDGSVRSEWRTAARTGHIFGDIARGLMLQLGQCVFSREALQALGEPFPVQVAGEDLDYHFLLRLSKAHQFFYVPQVFLRRTVHGQTMTRGGRVRDIMTRRVACIDDIFGQEAKAIKRRYLGRRVYAEWYRTSGLQKAEVKQIAAARRLMLISLLHWPFQPYLYAWLVYHGLPARARQALRELKRLIIGAGAGG